MHSYILLFGQVSPIKLINYYAIWKEDLKKRNDFGGPEADDRIILILQLNRKS